MKNNHYIYKALGLIVLCLACSLLTACLEVLDPECGTRVIAGKPLGSDSVVMRIYYKDSLIYKATNDDDDSFKMAGWDDGWDLFIRKGSVTVDLEVFCDKGSVHLPRKNIDVDLAYYGIYRFVNLKVDKYDSLEFTSSLLAPTDLTCGKVENYGLDYYQRTDCHD